MKIYGIYEDGSSETWNAVSGLAITQHKEGLTAAIHLRFEKRFGSGSTSYGHEETIYSSDFPQLRITFGEEKAS